MSKKEMTATYLATLTAGNITTLIIFGAIPLFITAVTSAITAVNIKKMENYDENDELKKSYKNMVIMTVVTWIGGFFMALASPVIFPFLIGFPMYILGFFIILSGIVFMIMGILSIVANVHIAATDDYKNTETSSSKIAYKATLAASITCMLSGIFSISYAFYGMISYYQRDGMTGQAKVGLDVIGKVGMATGQPEVTAAASAAKGVLEDDSKDNSSKFSDLFGILKGTDTDALQKQAAGIQQQASQINKLKTAQAAVDMAKEELLKVQGKKTMSDKMKDFQDLVDCARTDTC